MNKPVNRRLSESDVDMSHNHIHQQGGGGHQTQQQPEVQGCEDRLVDESHVAGKELDCGPEVTVDDEGEEPGDDTSPDEQVADPVPTLQYKTSLRHQKLRIDKCLYCCCSCSCSNQNFHQTLPIPTKQCSHVLFRYIKCHLGVRGSITSGVSIPLCPELHLGIENCACGATKG